MADIKAQLKTKNGDNLYPVTSMAYVTATFNGGLQFNSSTNTLSTYRIPIASVSALSTSLGAKQAKCSAGFRTEINGATVAQARYFNITSNHSAGALTLSAGCAYRIFATGNTVSLSAENFGGAQFGLEGHATILVTNNSLLTFGSNVVLGQPLVNDAVNNCTLRFHDGHCIIDVEDHDAAHTVTVATGTGSGTLYYYCSAGNTTTNETPQFISISDALDGGLVSFNGVSVNGEKHIAGNGTERTSLTSSFTPSSRTYITHAAFSDLTCLTGGTVYATDCAVPYGDEATFSSPLYIYDKLTVDGTLYTAGQLYVGAYTTTITGSGTIDLRSKHIDVTAFGSDTVVISGNDLTVSNGYATNGGFIYGNVNITGVTALYCSGTNVGNCMCMTGDSILSSCTVMYNSGGNAQAVSITSGAAGSGYLYIESCIISGNSGPYIGRDLGVNTVASAVVKDSVVGDIGLYQNGCIGFLGSNRVDSIGIRSTYTGTFVTLSSGAILDLTGNDNTTPIAPGGGVIFEPGGATIITSDGRSCFADNVTFSSGTNIKNDGTIDFGGSSGINLYGSYVNLTVSGFTFINALSNQVINAYATSGDVYVTNCNFPSDNTTITYAINARSTSVVHINGCTFSPYQRLLINQSNSIMRFTGRNVLQSMIVTYGSAVFESGTTLDLVGNTNNTVIYPYNAGHFIVSGSLTVVNSAGIEVLIPEGTYTTLTKAGVAT